MPVETTSKKGQGQQIKKPEQVEESVDMGDIQFGDEEEVTKVGKTQSLDDYSDKPRNRNTAINIARDFPKPPARRLKDNDAIFEYLSSLTQEHFTYSIDAYLYRTYPIINRKQVDPSNFNYIDCINQPFNEKWLLQEHGSGTYKLLLSDKSMTKNAQFFEAYITLNDPDKPPKFDLAELDIAHRNNKRFVDQLRAEGKLNAKGEVVQQNQGGTNNSEMISLVRDLINQKQYNNGRPDSSMDTVAQMFGKTHEATIAMLKDQMKSDDPDKMLKMMTLIMSIMPKAESNNGLLELLLKTQSDARAAESSLTMKMIEMMNAKNNAPVEDAEDKFLNRITKYKELGLFGSGEEGRSHKPSTAELLIEHGAPIVGKVFEVIGSIVNMKNFEKGMKIKNDTQTQVTTQAVLPEGQHIEQPIEQPVETIQEQVMTPKDQLKALLSNQAGFVVKAIQSGTSGYDFGDTLNTIISTMQGKAVAEELFKGIVALGKDELLNCIKEIPEIWEHVKATPSVVETFVGEFIEVCEGEEEEGDKE